MGMGDASGHSRAELADAYESLEGIFDAAAGGVVDLSPVLERRLFDLLDTLWSELQNAGEVNHVAGTNAIEGDAAREWATSWGS